MTLKDLGFKQRFVLISLLFLAGFAILLLVGWRTLDEVRVNGPLYEQIERDKDLIADVLPPPKYIVGPQLLAYQMVASPEQLLVYRGNLEAAKSEFERRTEYWEELLPDGDLKRVLLVDSVKPATAFFQIVEDELVPTIQRNPDDPTKALALLKGKLQDQFREHRLAIDRAVSLARQNVSDHEKAAANAVEKGMLWTTVIAILVVAFVSLLAIVVMNSVLKGMRLIIERMKGMALADADLTSRLGIESKDEVGELARWIDAFVEKIAGLVAAVKRSSIQLTSTATEMTATSREQETTVNGFAASTNQIAAAVREISATGSELTQTMEEVRDTALSAAGLAMKGRESLGDMESSMTELADSSGSISTKLAVINEKANDINVVVTTITKVADQTNLLSVNAAIEAEKAGEYGRGFLVVAREIRRLADQTAAATLDIEETVSQMQGAVSAGVMEMDKFADQVRRSVATMAEVSGQLGDVIEQVQANTRRFEAVTDGMASQALGAEQINAAMGSLTANVQQTTSSLHEFTEASEDLRRAVDALKAEMSRFRLEE